MLVVHVFHGILAVFLSLESYGTTILTQVYIYVIRQKKLDILLCFHGVKKTRGPHSPFRA